MVRKVTVIMNCINEREDFLTEAINSYLRQKNVVMQLIVSTVEGDDSINFIGRYWSSTDVLVVAMPRDKHPIATGVKSPKGSFLQLNNALPYMKGDWFCFASSNDIAYNNKCADEIEICIKNEKEVCYSSMDLLKENGRKYENVPLQDYDWDYHLKRNFVADCSMIGKRLVDLYLPFHTELNNYAYWDLWLRIRKVEGNVFIYNKNPTWGYRQDNDSMHVKRKQSKELQRQAQMDKEDMLNLHL